ncbi:STAS domain-containing protein [Asanoa sp. WMMD1127]|uniref:STAS domain-containing protein n=1 Tax=Asanoa sp. WMMD1127 TaxID=3016107 RepID=UPI002415E769|nr:STAS domain-containing protein [Asanoa sp. WMMD1127]MDG4823024.1 STAS domain-containing protein [Asanoa sp. WMMD1127]
MDPAPRQAAGGPRIEETDSAPLLIFSEPAGDLVRVRLAGELDMSTAPELLERITALAAGGTPRLLVELGALRFCDSAGLTVFVRGDRRCAEAGGWLRLTGANGHVARVIEIAGVGDALDYRPS